ncbi:hypothetical protein AC579_10001 [Pseudocercospora musae]|uniref:Uncharacterized protein n=1 Tax=Pseudocercospora musae TaxID=113226 RepID=A0A139I4V6_9PEZI|nr:hypothetical protein AC579_10001 [Pseudocercospora musae]
MPAVLSSLYWLCCMETKQVNENACLPCSSWTGASYWPDIWSRRESVASEATCSTMPPAMSTAWHGTILEARPHRVGQYCPRRCEAYEGHVNGSIVVEGVEGSSEARKGRQRPLSAELVATSLGCCVSIPVANLIQESFLPSQRNAPIPFISVPACCTLSSDRQKAAKIALRVSARFCGHENILTANKQVFSPAAVASRLLRGVSWAMAGAFRPPHGLTSQALSRWRAIDGRPIAAAISSFRANHHNHTYLEPHAPAPSLLWPSSPSTAVAEHHT